MAKTEADFTNECKIFWVDLDFATQLNDGPMKGRQFRTNAAAQHYPVHAKDEEEVRKLVAEACDKLNALHDEFSKKKDPKHQEEIVNVQLGWASFSQWGRGGRKEGPTPPELDVTVENIQRGQGAKNPVGDVVQKLAAKILNLYVDRWFAEMAPEPQKGKKASVAEQS